MHFKAHSAPTSVTQKTFHQSCCADQPVAKTSICAVAQLGSEALGKHRAHPAQMG